MDRIFSGVQPTGDLHLGNYLGALKNWVRLQHDYDCLYCVVDLHAITVWQDPGELASNTREVTAGLIAAGLDPADNIIFNQSQVAEHAELAWIFNCIARLGWLNRMTQFKEKAGKNRENASVGLYAYPNLMAADILLYKATHVPVGEDQKQHLELARDIAQKFNGDYGVELFPLPEPLILGAAARIMSLRDGSAKMSKSDVSENSRINMTDDADAIARKLRRAKTDPEALPADIDGLEGRPEAANLLGIYSALADRPFEDVVADQAGRQFSEFKESLTELAVAVLAPIGAEMARLISDPGYLDGVLADGAERASNIARPIIDEVFDTMGILNLRARRSP
ncbi:MAG: tryptophan--tRNA ligase [Rhodospirillales bacterium]|jgi:tryptophanyl-tRNA synthetase|nr:tryptophan--tRNA ligase [Rhodospirillaceae bacterium]MDP6429912.1 tryptophan--tRNA ligase [Rhodospirillales bacterium]MDP6642624.1 tryptophan--tRNA ligase [Rhodospirillales bacterium]MDP6840552.1 tryptophan--tRNA ligase [Rhodospirillales bacterium]|tara:strand:- start:2536 stop:3552 length:1017 start_codon:yes stop_codon:yes gene_type:complete